MKLFLICVFPIILFLNPISCQDIDLSYYLPDITYDQSIPTPREFIGHEVGQWHVTHDKLYFYASKLASLSDRITLHEYARSHEDRPLIYLTITSTENHGRLEEIRIEHKKLTDTRVSESVNIENMPIVLYQGCSIHGNEPSGSNAALAMMYYLAAGQSDQVEELLNNAVILFDPSFNPDGLQRFSTWANTHKGHSLITDPNSREFDEVWPGGRTNHYWFDLNRDWLLLTHPESRGRIRTFHSWKPDILTDHHEMGSNSTFFFQPGLPSRTNPNTPGLNQQLTEKIGEFHGRALDRIGSLYYSKESYDDYYYGKGSTYPDAQGCIGILFEQASSRGHARMTDHGILTFPFTIRNQVTTMLSTQEAALALRRDILEYKRQSFLEGRTLAQDNPVKAYVFSEKSDTYREARFLDILLRHQIEIYKLGKDIKTGELDYDAGESYVVPLDQNQYRLAKSIFEKVTTFEDSLFYDVSAWTLPLAFNLAYGEIRQPLSGFLGDQITSAPLPKGSYRGEDAPYAYLVEWNQYLAPRMLYEMKEMGLIVKLANEPFESMVNGQFHQFERGTLIIPDGNNQQIHGTDLKALMIKMATDHHLEVIGVSSGLVGSGVNLGTRSSDAIERIKPAMFVGEGVSSANAGELWHHFDQILKIPVPMLDVNSLRSVNLNDYNTLIMPDGSYSSLNGYTDKLKTWISSGGKVIAIGRALRWLKNRELISLDDQITENPDKKKEENKFLNYANAQKDNGAKVTGGMIAMTNIDLTHPLFYGYSRPQLPVFKRGNDFYKPVSNPYRTPARYASSPVLSGYLHKDNLEKMSQAAAVFTSNLGRGRIIGLVDNPVFRGYWWGSSKLLANALFFGDTIN